MKSTPHLLLQPLQALWIREQEIRHACQEQRCCIRTTDHEQRRLREHEFLRLVSGLFTEEVREEIYVLDLVAARDAGADLLARESLVLFEGRSKVAGRNEEEQRPKDGVAPEDGRDGPDMACVMNEAYPKVIFSWCLLSVLRIMR